MSSGSSTARAASASRRAASELGGTKSTIARTGTSRTWSFALGRPVLASKLKRDVSVMPCAEEAAEGSALVGSSCGRGAVFARGHSQPRNSAGERGAEARLAGGGSGQSLQPLRLEIGRWRTGKRTGVSRGTDPSGPERPLLQSAERAGQRGRTH